MLMIRSMHWRPVLIVVIRHNGLGHPLAPQITMLIITILFISLRTIRILLNRITIQIMIMHFL